MGGSPDLLGPAAHPSGQPVVAMHDVVGRVAAGSGVVGGCVSKDSLQEPREVRGELILRHRRARTGLDVDQPGSGSDLLDLGRTRAVASRIDVRRDPLLGEAFGYLDDIHVHSTRVAGTRLVQRRRVQADHRHFGRRVEGSQVCFGWFLVAGLRRHSSPMVDDLLHMQREGPPPEGRAFPTGFDRDRGP